MASLYSTFTLVGTVVVEDALDSESLPLSPLLLLLLELSWLTPLPSAEVSVTPVMGTFATSCVEAAPRFPNASATMITSSSKIITMTAT